MLTLEQLKQTHATYGTQVKTWDYLNRSASGGTIYREAGYLRKYLDEDTAPGGNQYAQRLISTALDNHVQTVVNVYRGYLFRTEPTRTLGDAGELAGADKFIEDCDLDQTDLDDFQKSVSDMLSIYGTAWIAVDRPAYQAQTRAEEIALDIRPYVSLYAPTQVLDWQYERALNGKQELVYVKIREASFDSYDVLRVWTPTVVHEYHVERGMVNGSRNTTDINVNSVSSQSVIEYVKILQHIEYINPLGCVPVFCAYNGRKVENGVGNSDIADVADHQRSIYNLCSELEQNIRISSSPSLVKTADTQASGGAGAIITIQENLPGDLKPYLLQPNSATVDSILSAIAYHKEAIDRMTHLSAIRGEKTQSGVAQEADFMVLGARLADKAAKLEKIEYKIWDLFFAWQGISAGEEFEINYEKSFNIRDKQRELNQLAQGLSLVTNPLYQAEAQKAIVAITLEDDEVIESIQLDIDNNLTVIAPVEPEMIAPPANVDQAYSEILQEDMVDGCPLPMMDKATNITNHQICIEQANLGPANPNAAENVFWMAKAELWNVTDAEARTRLCSNCKYYVNTQAIKDCFSASADAGTLPQATDVDPTWTNTTDAAAYCVKWDITCTASRTCDTWAPGGPIVD